MESKCHHNLRNGYSTQKADDTNGIGESFLSLDLFSLTFKNGGGGDRPYIAPMDLLLNKNLLQTQHTCNLRATGCELLRTIRYDTIAQAILTCDQKLKRVSLIYRTERQIKKIGKTTNKNGYAQK